MADLTMIEGIGKTYSQKLHGIGIDTTSTLLERGASPKGRQEVAKLAGINRDLILRWVNHADLFRISGVGEEYADLLEDVGVDTVPELARRNPEHLYQKLAEVNQKKKRVRQLPSQAQVNKWVDEATLLPRIISY